MNSISIDNEKYVKATDIARELGYTADYVGQLCRAKKVDARLVGRSWYVSEDSIRDHKKNRYRNTKSLHKKTISTSIATKDADFQTAYAVPVSINSQKSASYTADKSFYSRVSQKKATPSYFSDEADLIPAKSSIKTGRLTVELGDSLPVKITSKSHAFDFVPEEREVLKFQGPLKVTDVYEEDTEADKAPQEEMMQEKVPVRVSDDFSQQFKSKYGDKKQKRAEKASKIKVKHLRKERQKNNTSNQPLEKNAEGIIGMTNTPRRVTGGTLAIPASLQESTTVRTSRYLVYISIPTALLLALLMVGMQVSILTEGVNTSLSYTFTFDNLAASIVFLK